MGVVKVYLLISFIFTGGISAAVISAAVYAEDWMSQQLGPFAVFHIEFLRRVLKPTGRGGWPGFPGMFGAI